LLSFEHFWGGGCWCSLNALPGDRQNQYKNWQQEKLFNGDHYFLFARPSRKVTCDQLQNESKTGFCAAIWRFEVRTLAEPWLGDDCEQFKVGTMSIPEK
jgi:hypothetical protein